MQEQEAKLQQEILQDARKKAERLIERANKESAKLKSTVETQQAQEREQLLARAAQDTAAKTRAILAGIRYDIQKHWLLTRESVIESVFQEALARVMAGRDLDRHQSLGELLTEAVLILGPEKEIKISCRPEDASFFTPGRLTEIATRTGDSDGVSGTWRVTPDPALPGGLVIASADGRRRVDQTYPARINRLRRRLRAEVAELIQIPHAEIERLLKEGDVHE